MEVVVSSSQVVSAAPSSSWGGLLTLCPCSSVGSLPWETVLHKLLQCASFPWGAALHKLLQSGSPMGSQVLPENLLHLVLLSPWDHRSCQEPAPAQASHGVTASFGHPPAIVWGPSWAAGGYLLHHRPPWTAGGQPASPWSSPRSAGESLLWRLHDLLPLLLH